MAAVAVVAAAAAAAVYVVAEDGPPLQPPSHSLLSLHGSGQQQAQDQAWFFKYFAVRGTLILRILTSVN